MPNRRAPASALASLALLLVALFAVVGLAEEESPAVERAVTAAGFPQTFVGVVIATLVLLPETLAAVRAARRGRIQTSLNLAYGSAMASIGLTIPAIALASVWLRGPLVLGLGAIQLVLLALTVVDQHADRGARSGHPAAGRGASGAARRLRVPGDHPLTVCRARPPDAGTSPRVADRSPPRCALSLTGGLWAALNRRQRELATVVAIVSGCPLEQVNAVHARCEVRVPKTRGRPFRGEGRSYRHGHTSSGCCS